MKTLFINISAVIFLICGVCNSNNLHAQDSAKIKKKANKAALVRGMIDSLDFVFIPTYVTPLRGSRRYLNTSYYYLDLKKDTMNTYLPYFGRTYVAPLTSSDITFDFSSTNFEVSTTVKKKGEWEILMKLKDQVDVQQLYLTVFNDGSAWLSINTLNRDPISFEGYITKPKPNKKK